MNDDDLVVLAAHDIRKRYGGVQALRGVTVEIRRGQVLGLAGSNGSGKSTLIKIVTGVEQPDSGRIEIAGSPAAHLNVRRALGQGIQVIHQDLSLLASLFANLTVAENIAMTARVTDRAHWFSRESARATAEEALARIGVDGIDVSRLLGDLSIGQRQQVAICRALAHNARVLFMDEPTTALTWREVDRLFTIVDALRRDGVAIVFVSHKTHEMLGISDRITVLRNGEVVASGATANFDRASLSEALVGNTLADAGPRQMREASTDVVLNVHSLAAAHLFRDITFDVRAGEIVGLTGLVGSGRSEIAEAIFGLVRTTGGSVSVSGTTIRPGAATAATAAGISYVPPDRLNQGLFLDQSISRNLIASIISRISGKLGNLRLKQIDDLVDQMVRSLSIKIGSSSDPVRNLSGGNAQKVVIGKWLATSPTVLMLNGPTVGIDIAAKAAILDLLRQRAATGMAVLLISDDIEELINACDRVLVIRRGRLVRQIVGAAITYENLREASLT